MDKYFQVFLFTSADNQWKFVFSEGCVKDYFYDEFCDKGLWCVLFSSVCGFLKTWLPFLIMASIITVVCVLASRTWSQEVPETYLLYLYNLYMCDLIRETEEIWCRRQNFNPFLARIYTRSVVISKAFSQSKQRSGCVM